MVNKETIQRIYLLAGILFDQTATISDRDDAAMYLGDYEVNISLVGQILKDFLTYFPDEDDTLISSCGESLGYIWIRNEKFDKEFYKTLPYYAKNEINGLIKNTKPEWMPLIENQQE